MLFRMSLQVLHDGTESRRNRRRGPVEILGAGHGDVHDLFFLRLEKLETKVGEFLADKMRNLQGKPVKLAQVCEQELTQQGGRSMQCCVALNHDFSLHGLEFSLGMVLPEVCGNLFAAQGTFPGCCSCSGFLGFARGFVVRWGTAVGFHLVRWKRLGFHAFGRGR